MTTPQNQVAEIANRLIALGGAMAQQGQQIANLAAEWTNLSVANSLDAFPTAPLLPTGGLGTADATPDPANPIDVRTTDGAMINRALSANDIAGILTSLKGVSDVIKGLAVAANGATVQLFAKCL